AGDGHQHDQDTEEGGTRAGAFASGHGRHRTGRKPHSGVRQSTAESVHAGTRTGTLRDGWRGPGLESRRPARHRHLRAPPQGRALHNSTCPTTYGSAAGSSTAASAPAQISASVSHRDQPCSTTNPSTTRWRSEEHTSELQSRENLVCRLLLEK